MIKCPLFVLIICRSSPFQVDDPAIYYLNAHIVIPTDGDADITNAIRGQLIQGFDVKLDDASIDPFMMVPGSMGTASVEFFAAGATACFSIDMSGFQPVLGHIHKATSDMNGPVAIDFSSIILDQAFDGCVESDPDIASATLLNPSEYYFNIHQDGVDSSGNPLPGFFKAVRGNL